MTEDERQINKPKEEWVAKLRYSHSFMAKLVMSEPTVKEYYAALATKLLGYDKVRSNVSWNGIQFAIGRRTIARVTFGGKTLVVYFALDPAAYAQGKYRLTDVGATKRYAVTQGKLRITSARALAYALRLVDDLAQSSGLVLRSVPIPPVSPKDFPTDRFQNLVARGLIRLLKTDVTSDAQGASAPVLEVKVAEGADIKVSIGGNQQPSDQPEAVGWTDVDEVYRDTLATATQLTERHDAYRSLLDAMHEGDFAVHLTRRNVLSPIDETWVQAIEDSLTALDEVTRNPGHFIEETEELLPIERTKKVTQRSIQHLSQHSGLISRIEGDTIIPSKLLNVFRDDSLMTYENKFVNTLLARLYDFVTIRYEAAKEGADRELTALDIDDRVEMGDALGRVTMHVQLSTPIRERGRNYALQSNLWKRVEKLYETVCDYQGSAFVQEMGNAFIRPPVMRTNPILKNKNLSQCMALWEFIEGYEDADGLTNDEEELSLSPDYLSHLYREVATQYLTFRQNALNAKTWEAPKAVSAPKAAQRAQVPEVENDAQAEADSRLWAVEVALAADLILDEMGREEREALYAERQARLSEEQEEEIAPPEPPRSVVDATPVVMPDKAQPVDWGREESEPANAEKEEPAESEERTEVVRVHEDGTGYREVTTYRKSLQAKLQLADDVIKSRYVGIYNRFASKVGVKERMSFEYVTFSVGGKALARMTIIGKTLRVYYALNAGEIDAKYGVKDASSVKKYAATPALLYVRGNRSYVYALDLADMVCAGLETSAQPALARVEDYPNRTLEALVAAGLIQRTVTAVPLGQSLFEAKSTPLALRETKPDADYSADYLKAARKMMAKEKEVPSRTIDLEGVVKSSEVLAVLQRTDAALETERKERLKEEMSAPAPLAEGGDGDALILRREAMMTADANAVAVPPVEPAPQPQPKAPVPMGGDALTPKPITMEEIDKMLAEDNDDRAADSANADGKRKQPRLWRRRRKDRR